MFQNYKKFSGLGTILATASMVNIFILVKNSLAKMSDKSVTLVKAWVIYIYKLMMEHGQTAMGFMGEYNTHAETDGWGTVSKNRQSREEFLVAQSEVKNCSPITSCNQKLFPNFPVYFGYKS